MTPTFLYIGTSKAGSTWLFNVLAQHPQVFLASSKGLYFFDSHFDRGEEWYLSHFARAGGRRARGEVSHSYLSSPEAAARIARMNPDMRLLVCLREPVDRAFSDYLDLVKNGQYAGPFTDAIERFPRLLDRGRYATHLRRYYDVFPREQIQVQLFDDLRVDAQLYADRTFDFLGVDRLQLPLSDLKGRMPAATPRNATAVSAAKTASRAVKRIGLNRLRSRVKRSAVVRNALYRPYREERPSLDPALAELLRRGFAQEMAELDRLLGTPVSSRWGYSPSATGSPVG